jgi:hypothetical protein
MSCPVFSFFVLSCYVIVCNVASFCSISCPLLSHSIVSVQDTQSYWPHFRWLAMVYALFCIIICSHVLSCFLVCWVHLSCYLIVPLTTHTTLPTTWLTISSSVCTVVCSPVLSSCFVLSASYVFYLCATMHTILPIVCIQLWRFAFALNRSEQGYLPTRTSTNTSA